MTTKRILRILFWLAALAPLAIALCFAPFMPEQVAVHFGASGAPDRWGSWLELLAPGAISIVTAAIFEAYATHEDQRDANRIHLVGCLPSLAFAAITGVLCAANVGAAAGAHEVPELSLYCYIPFVCWTAIGLFLLIARTTRYLNLNAPWLLLDHEKDRRAALFGGVLMVLAGCIALAIAILTEGSLPGFVVSSLLGCAGLLALYTYGRYLRTHD